MVNCNLHGTATIKSRNSFKIPADKFIISPLSTSCNIYIDSIVSGVTNPSICGTTEQNDYTIISGVIPFTQFHVDTNETFYIKW